MECDVKASAPLTATGSFTQASDGTTVLGRVRIRGIRVLNGVSAGSLVFRDGPGGPILLSLDCPAAADEGSSCIHLPGQGILAARGVHGTVTGIVSATIFYSG